MPARILIVEDETIIALDLQARLETMDYTVVGRARDSESAVSLALEHAPDIILMDIQIAGSADGITTAEVIQSQMDVPVLFLTAYSDKNDLDRAKKTDAYGYLLKPFQERELFITVEMALYRHRAERTMRTTGALLETTLNTVSEGIVATDSAGEIILVNPAAEILTGWIAAEALGKSVDEVIQLDEQAEIDPDRPGKVWWLRDKKGRQREVELFRKSVSDAHGDLDRNVIVLRDISTIRDYERSLFTAKRIAEGASEAKSEFIARMSHELKTPLNVIQGMISLVQEDELSVESAENLSIAASSVGDLGRQIRDVLDFSVADSGDFKVRPEPFSPLDLIEEVAAKSGLEAARKALRLAAVVPPELADTFVADWRHLGKVIEILVSNAVKFTLFGSVLITAWLDAEEGRDEQGQLSVRVEDTGPGIAPEDRGRVFEDFSQLAPSRTRSVGGAGLGLALARKLAVAMGGDIAISERDDATAGTVATVCLPVDCLSHRGHRTADSAEELPEMISGMQGMRLVTSDSLALKVLRPWQKKGGFSVEGTEEGSENRIEIVVSGNSRWIDTEEIVPLTIREVGSAFVATVDTGEKRRVGTTATTETCLDSVREALEGGDREAAMDLLARYRRINAGSESGTACFRAYLALRSGDIPGALRIIQRCSEGKEEI